MPAYEAYEVKNKRQKLRCLLLRRKKKNFVFLFMMSLHGKKFVNGPVPTTNIRVLLRSLSPPKALSSPGSPRVVRSRSTSTSLTAFALNKYSYASDSLLLARSPLSRERARARVCLGMGDRAAGPLLSASKGYGVIAPDTHRHALLFSCQDAIRYAFDALAHSPRNLVADHLGSQLAAQNLRTHT